LDGIGRVLDQIAARQRITKSEFIRRLLLRELEAAGVKLEERVLA
jgi:hypothetical protein